MPECPECGKDIGCLVFAHNVRKFIEMEAYNGSLISVDTIDEVDDYDCDSSFSCPECNAELDIHDDSEAVAFLTLGEHGLMLRRIERDVNDKS